MSRVSSPWYKSPLTVKVIGPCLCIELMLTSFITSPTNHRSSNPAQALDFVGLQNSNE